VGRDWGDLNVHPLNASLRERVSDLPGLAKAGMEVQVW
jgi:hypothetical protein